MHFYGFYEFTSRWPINFGQYCMSNQFLFLHHHGGHHLIFIDNEDRPHKHPRCLK